MITPEEQIQLKNIIGAHYAEDVSEILNNKGIRNRNGIPHNFHYIRAVFAGTRNNIDVEKAILELASNKRAESQKIEKQKMKILKEI